MHTKILIRPENFHLRFQQWHEKQFHEQLKRLSNSYAASAFADGADDLSIDQTAQHAHLNWSPEHFDFEQMAFLTEHFKNRLLENKYFLQISDERSDVYDSGIRLTIHRHYLKPESDPTSPSRHLLYGNVFIEHTFSNSHNAIAIKANYYGDRDYFGFEKLMELLLKPA